MENWPIFLSPCFSLSIPKHPIQKLSRSCLIIAVTWQSEKVQDNWHCEQHDSHWDGKVKNGSESKQSSSNPHTDHGDWQTMVEGSVKISRNTGIDVFIKIELFLGYLSDGLFLLQQVEDSQV